MRMVEKGAPQLVKQPDGSYRLEVPVDFHFDSQEEADEVEQAFKQTIAERMARLRGEK